MEEEKTLEELEREVAQLRDQFEEANDTIDAIRNGQIDALVVKEEMGHQLYTLKSADQTYRVFIEKMREGAVTLNSEGLILYSNSRFASMVNLPLSKVIGVPFNNFITEDDKEICSLLIKEGWKAESKGEVGLLSINRETFPILISLVTLELDEGTALSITLTDLSSQKEIEKQLKLKNEQLLQAHNSLEQLNNELETRVAKRTRELAESREHFKFLAENIPVIVWTSKPNGDRDYYNRKWYEYTAMTFEETKGLGWQKAIHPDDREGIVAAWTEAIKTEKDYYVEYRLLRASDQTYRWHSGSGLPFKNDIGETIAWIGIVTDIEEHKMTLARKDEFISMASHELKTPVTTIKAFAEILLYDFQNENNTTATDYLTKMNRQIDKLTRLIADLLDATKVNAGMLQFEEENFDFNELVIEMADQMQLTSLRHKIELNLSKTCNICGDRGRLGQVINNLISNAIKYSPSASRIIVGTDVTANSVELSVQDFGIGIPIEQQSEVFNRFFRAGDTKAKNFPGLGLGLYISNEIIKRHSGTLTFKSEVGKGSTFYMNLPIAS